MKDIHFYTTPTFETGDPRYEWLNSVIAVGEGRLFNTGDGNFAVEYSIHAPTKILEQAAAASKEEL